MEFTTFVTFFGISYFGLLTLTCAMKVAESEVTLTPSELHVAKFEGENYLVSCKSKETSQTYWQNPRRDRVGTSEQNRIRTEANVGLELYFNDIKMEDAGTYTCNGRPGAASFNLTVVRPIVFDPSFAIQSAQEGRDYVIKCVARGHTANTKIVWRIDYRPPSGKGRFRQQPDGSLLVKGVTEADGRHKYVCRAMDVNSARPDTKDMTIVLKVQMKPKLQGPARKDMYGVDGQWANLTCSVLAEPPARFEWYFGNKRLGTSNDVFIFNQSENLSVLHQLIRKGADFGDYICKAINSMGIANQTLTLKRAKKPRTPSLSVLDKGSTGVAVRVKNPNDPGRYNDPAVDGDKRIRAEELAVIGYSVQYKMLKKENWVTASNVTQTGYGFILRNLIPNVTYLIRAASINLASTGDYSTELEVQTPKNSPFNPPTNGAPTLTPILEYSILNLAFLTLLIVNL